MEFILIGYRDAEHVVKGTALELGTDFLTDIVHKCQWTRATSNI